MASIMQSAAMSWEVDNLELQCPRCAGRVETSSEWQSFICEGCGFLLKLHDGIWCALSAERADYFSRFIADYQMIRAAEGRGSNTEDYYLGLPYKDVSGNNSAQWKIRACTFTCICRYILPKLQNGARILDVGAGNGWMSYRLAQMGFHPAAIDLLINDQDGLGAAKRYRSHLANLFPCFQAESNRLPFVSEQFDAVIFNASFHYAESYKTVLGEALRCLKSGGIVLIADTPWYSNQANGERMLEERRATFLHRFGTASDSIPSLEYLTDDQLSELEQLFNIRWERYTPFYGIRWALRPIIARMHGRRQPAWFRIYSARKTA